ncbi:asparagine synthase (glutamine-hydrolyzing) [Vibrio profundum]|uniref:asparagine synthase (glutamine-hydrolyzing) n=1 Tax=Vibrio profundum TaxID=2910247 RepID=UPI003D10AF90
MCGIAGLFTLSSLPGFDIKAMVQNMAQELVHRGPDAVGSWADNHSGVALAHRRLAILDLTDAGHQPMKSSCGRYKIVFNGEIYNHLQIRKKLQSTGSPVSLIWRGHSDTETILTAVSAWGLEKALNEFVGMFAFALWDKHAKSLYLARDRLGEKPLYYGFHRGAFLFGSELKALKASPGFKGEVDRNVLSLYLNRNFIPAPYSIYQGIFKLPPATWLKISEADVVRQQLPDPISYWSLSKVALMGQSNLFQGSENDALLKLEQLLKQSISSQMIADVPLGAFLSGGIDSSTVVALMQAQSADQIRTFTIGFNESDYDESKHAAAVAAHIGTEHTELCITSEQAMEVIPGLAKLYDEPFADVSQIPTFLVSQLARQDVTVCLSGDGGDELFGGYNRHITGPALWRKLGWLPNSMRSGLSKLLTAIPPSLWDSYVSRSSTILPRSLRYRSAGDKIYKIARMLSVTSPEEIYDRLVSQLQKPEQIVIGSFKPLLPIKESVCSSDIVELEHRLMFMDTATYLPDDILVKVDRAAMGVSLETRVPMLDHRVVEFAWSLPLAMKIQGNKGKFLLRKLLDRYVPRALIERPKAGFGVPIGTWLRGPLRPWAEELLDNNKLNQQGYFDPSPIRLMWKEHLQGKRNWSHQLWGILMFQAWLDEHHDSQ